MYTWLLIGGRFDDEGGRQSSYIDKLYTELLKLNSKGHLYNGGLFSDINQLQRYINYVDVILWFPDIPNDKDKIVRGIKNIFPRTILVSSKFNDNTKYSDLELIARALQSKSNLLVEFVRLDEGMIASRVLDPLGNLFVFTADIKKLALVLTLRLNELTKFTRISSSQYMVTDEPVVNKTFLDLIHHYAEEFHSLIHAVNSDRFLGNCSFRCESGFPSFKQGNSIWVSRRNIDKKDINEHGFVKVEMQDFTVFYSGEHKPSVDTPIQLMLYNYYPNIKFMLHSHVYIENAPMTDKIIPCGAIEEFYEIVKLIGTGNNYTSIHINLRGHGSLVMASDVSAFENIAYIPRKIPEIQML